MNQLFILVGFLCFAYIEARTVTTDCDRIVIQNVQHEKEVLKADLKYPFQLAVDYDTNTLFYSTSAATDEYFQSNYIDLNTNTPGVITGIDGGFANAVDHKNHVVYIGANDGLYKYDYATKTATKMDVTDDNIWQMFYKDHLYYTTHPFEKAFVIKNGKKEPVPELLELNVEVLALDNENNIFFSNDSGLYTFNKDSKKVESLGDYTANAFTTDKDGNIYFSATGAVYYINEEKKVIEEIAQVKDIFGVAIDANHNIIYATKDSIIRLKPTDKECTVETAGTN